MANRLPRFLDFTRPGNDLVDDMRFPPFIRFWRRYGRNLLKLLQLNLFYSVLTLPIYVWITSLLNAASVQAGGGVFTLLGAMILSTVMYWPTAVLAALLLASVLILGPATAALSFAALNCAWDRPGMFWPNFWQAFRENWKQALPFGLLDAFALYATVYYLIDGKTAFGEFGIALTIVWIILALLYSLMRVYLYPIMVTVKLSTSALIRNSLIFALLDLKRSLAVVGITLVLILLCMVADILLIPCFLYSFVAFTAAFLTEPIIKKYLFHPEAVSEDKPKIN